MLLGYGIIVLVCNPVSASKNCRFWNYLDFFEQRKVLEDHKKIIVSICYY
jgi:hypothetical protein